MFELEEELMLLELLDKVLELELETELDDEVTLDLDEELMLELELVIELETLEEDEAFEIELALPAESDELDTAVPPPLHAEMVIAVPMQISNTLNFLVMAFTRRTIEGNSGREQRLQYTAVEIGEIRKQRIQITLANTEPLA